MPGYFIYCRKSSEAEDRQVLSIESQTRELEQIAAKLNLPIMEILTESKSAKEPGRPIFNQMMQRVYRGEAAGIICWKLDRLARNPVDGGSIIWAIKQHGIRVMTPAQSYAREDDNIILMYIEFGMAQKYVDDLSKNVKRGLKTKIENGWYPGVAPLGYLNNTNKLTGANTLIEDPERFPLVRRMWDMMLTGQHTAPQIVDMANNQWGFRTRPMRKKGSRPLCRSAIYKIFTMPFYYGQFEYPHGSGRRYRGKHAPLITEAEYDRVQTLLGRNGNPRPRTHGAFSFTGLIRCGECNGMVTAETKHQLMCGHCRFKFAYRRKTSCTWRIRN
jgi:DNA invertase Pin-like site-specific DNA recombinase